MYGMPQEEKDKYFVAWISEQRHRIELLQHEGFDKNQAIEMLKISSLENICTLISYK